jgi:hypothetical protein
VSENGSKKVKEAALTALDNTKKLMESGKSFDEALTEQSLTALPLGPFSINDRDTQSKDPSFRLLHQKASGLNPGDLSETIDENDRSLFFKLVSREMEDTEENRQRIESLISNSNNQVMMITFINWLYQQYDEADVKGLAVEDQ